MKLINCFILLFLYCFSFTTVFAENVTIENVTYIGLNYDETKQIEQFRFSEIKEIIMAIFFTITIAAFGIGAFYMCFKKLPYQRGNFMLLSKKAAWFFVGFTHYTFLFYIIGRFSDDQSLSQLLLKYLGFESICTGLIIYLYLGDELIKFGKDPEGYIRTWIKRYKEQKFLEGEQ